MIFPPSTKQREIIFTLCVCWCWYITIFIIIIIDGSVGLRGDAGEGEGAGVSIPLGLLRGRGVTCDYCGMALRGGSGGLYPFFL